MRFIFVFIFVLLFTITGCSHEKYVEPDSPTNAAFLMKYHIDQEQYTLFQTLFYDGTKDNVSKDRFKQFGEISTSGANYKNYELLTFDNGEMLLVEFAPKSEDEDEHKIVNVKVVPEEVKSFFQ
ncbi:hypothetical protein [Salinibacillus xinjiangensis]|uniref:Uncharacterized protein n=1 Tax=Salinibacillus xinjiangensis TaxID=1229268 RepID=A0A6G1X8F1_9BACI|nr:hypothetical protein [Salinibacillus xinjiangensis]MRG87244.1 hypothetical protein [Salinibacillus xinjiangensis]